MYYKTGYCFNSKDLFDGWNYSTLGIKTKVFYDKYQCKSLDYFLCL